MSRRAPLGASLTLAALACAAVTCATLAASAAAGTAPVTATVVAGTLSLSSSAAPGGSVTLDGTNQSFDYSLPLSVVDATGSGAGWNLTVTSTQFSTGGGSPKTLPTDASKMRDRTAVCATGTCTATANTISFPPPGTIPAGSTPPAPIKFFSTPVNTGLGSFTVTVDPVRVTVPGNAFAGVYTSVLTVAVVSGP
jgi:hypothetical protein